MDKQADSMFFCANFFKTIAEHNVKRAFPKKSIAHTEIKFLTELVESEHIGEYQ